MISLTVSWSIQRVYRIFAQNAVATIVEQSFEQSKDLGH